MCLTNNKLVYCLYLLSLFYIFTTGISYVSGSRYAFYNENGLRSFGGSISPDQSWSAGLL